MVDPPEQLVWIEYAEVEIYVTRRPKCLKRRFYTEETAKVLDVSPDTVKRAWRLAKLWLLRELEGEGR